MEEELKNEVEEEDLYGYDLEYEDENVEYERLYD